MAPTGTHAVAEVEPASLSGGSYGNRSTVVMPSSVIRNFQYLADQQALEVTFVSGRRYRYLQVPGDIYEGMRASFSKGEYFNRHVRDHFPFERIGLTQ